MFIHKVVTNSIRLIHIPGDPSTKRTHSIVLFINHLRTVSVLTTLCLFSELAHRQIYKDNLYYLCKRLHVQEIRQSFHLSHSSIYCSFRLQLLFYSSLPKTTELFKIPTTGHVIVYLTVV